MRTDQHIGHASGQGWAEIFVLCRIHAHPPSPLPLNALHAQCDVDSLYFELAYLSHAHKNPPRRTVTHKIRMKCNLPTLLRIFSFKAQSAGPANAGELIRLTALITTYVHAGALALQTPPRASLFKAMLEHSETVRWWDVARSGRGTQRSMSFNE